MFSLRLIKMFGINNMKRVCVVAFLPQHPIDTGAYLRVFPEGLVSGLQFLMLPERYACQSGRFSRVPTPFLCPYHEGASPAADGGG